MTKKNQNLPALEKIAHKSTKEPNEKVIRRSYALTRQDVERIQHIKEKGLNKRIVFSDSQVVRIGIKLAADLSEGELMVQAEQIQKLPTGRPKKSQ